MMTPTSKVAVCIPVYNAQRYLRVCIDSILAQTYKNFIIVAVDDGSKDTSGQILDDYAVKDKRVLVVHQKNGGFSAARNTALVNVEAIKDVEYVAFVDSDDVIEPNMLETLMNIVHEDNSEVAVCAYYYLSDDGERTVRGSLRDRETLSPESFLELVFALGEWRGRCGTGGMVWKHLYKASVIAGLRFPRERKLVEDELFEVMVAKRISKISFVPELLYGYRLPSALNPNNNITSYSMLKARHMCVEEARGISYRAYLIAVAAYVKTYLWHCKLKGELAPVLVTNDAVQQAATIGILDRKATLEYFAFSRFPAIFNFYITVRRFLRKGCSD